MKVTSTSEWRNDIKERDPHFCIQDKLLLKTFNNTTQLGKTNLSIPMRWHDKSRNPII